MMMTMSAAAVWLLLGSLAAADGRKLLMEMGEKCDPWEEWEADPLDKHRYYHCGPEGIRTAYTCPVVNGEARTFDQIEKRCLEPRVEVTEEHGRQKRQTLPSGAGSGKVGDGCAFNTDCITGGYCQNGACRCFSTHTNVGGFCWRKINPGQSGCTYDVQCSAVWPGGDCSSGTCDCPFSLTPVPTPDGPVCTLPGECPVNGANPRLLQGNQELATCVFGPFTLEPWFAYNWVGCGTEVNRKVVDCISAASDGSTAEGVQGYCCPTRAAACIQRRRAGTTSVTTTTSTRWWYNTITQACTSFTYRGFGGNANNFETQDQCESYCGATCERGSPEYDSVQLQSSATQTRGAIRYCSSTGTNVQGCSSNYECSRVGSTQICCPTPAFVCSALGGISPLAGVTPTSPDPGLSYVGGGSNVRWYWDENLGRCSTFTYFNQLGDFNRFMSESDCNEYCSKALCPQGEPLQDPAQPFTNQACSSQAQCPTTHFCTSNVCCPTVQTVCNQPQAIGGGCTGTNPRYWFNAQTGICTQFSFSGCKGNANNFETLLDCQNYCSSIQGEPKCIVGKALKDSNNNFYQCSANLGTSGNSGVIQSCPATHTCYFDGNLYGCCPTQAYTCARGPDPGTSCNPTSTTRWYYDSSTFTCKTFQYNGCDGNANNFDTLTDCQGYCAVSGCPDGGTTFLEANGQPRVCSVSRACPETHSCVSISVRTGVGGTISSRLSYCCPRKNFICSQVRSTGDICLSSTLTRYFFNSASRSCESFAYNGCGGNANNFPSLQFCLNYCNSAACESGESVFLDGNTVQTCTPGIINACPNGYRCVADRLNTRNVCCGSTDRGVCPSGQRAYINGVTGEPTQCQANIDGSCPGNYFCIFNNNRRLFYCCGTLVSTQCPNNAAAFVDPNTNEPRACTLNAADVCPQGFTCQSTQQTGNSYGFCCSGVTVSSGVCGQGVNVEVFNGVPRTCAFNVGNQCTPPYTCRRGVTGDNRFYCCSETQTNNVCGTNGVVYRVNNALIQCSQDSSVAPCPTPSTCQLSATGNGRYYCCTQNAFSSYCGEGSPQLIGGQPQQCNPGSNTCPGSFICELSAQLNAYYCCSSGGCPDGQEPYLVGNVPQYCTVGIISCPGTYDCLRRTSNARAQCCRPLSFSPFGVCPNGAQAFVNPQSGLSQTCTPNTPNACGALGFTCQIGSQGQGLCCPDNSLGSCPNGGTPYINPATGRTLPCLFTNTTSCPDGNTCLVGADGRAICCVTQNLGACTNGNSYIDSATGQPRVCSGSNPCPTGFVCGLSTTGGNICCDGNASPGSCPDGRTTFVDSTSGQPRICTATSDCPANYSCVQSAGSSGVCCQNTSPTTITRCVSGIGAYTGPDGRTQTCNNVGSDGECPNGFVCLRSQDLTSSLCCAGTTAACPIGTTAFINAVTETAQTCQPDMAFNCPSGYTCVTSNRQNICCSLGNRRAQQTNTTTTPVPVEIPVKKSSEDCPSGKLAYQNPVLKTAQTCAPQVPHTCPTGYTCIKHRDQNVCCSGNQNQEARTECPNNGKLYQFPNTTSPVGCSTSGKEKCPDGFSCQFSEIHSAEVCCEKK